MSCIFLAKAIPQREKRLLAGCLGSGNLGIGTQVNLDTFLARPKYWKIQK